MKDFLKLVFYTAKVAVSLAVLVLALIGIVKLLIG